jgi:hypothetical protein
MHVSMTRPWIFQSNIPDNPPPELTESCHIPLDKRGNTYAFSWVHISKIILHLRGRMKIKPILKMSEVNNKSNFSLGVELMSTMEVVKWTYFLSLIAWPWCVDFQKNIWNSRQYTDTFQQKNHWSPHYQSLTSSHP